MLEFRGQNGLWVKKVRESAIQSIKENEDMENIKRKKIGRQD